MGGSVEKQIQKALGSPARHAGIDAALVKADFLFAGAPTIENKIEQPIQNTKVASAKVAFDTVREFCCVFLGGFLKSNFKFKALRWRLLRWRLTLSDSRQKERPIKALGQTAH